MHTVDINEFAAELNKLSTSREKRTLINKKIDELRKFQKLTNGHYKSHWKFLKKIESAFPEFLEGRLSVQELVESMSRKFFTSVCLY